jgi:hypothetical protein
MPECTKLLADVLPMLEITPHLFSLSTTPSFSQF